MPDTAGGPVLSVVVVAYNMRREIPRTIRSMSPSMQKGIAAGDYEIIVMDNGSTDRFDESLCRDLAPNLRIERIENASVSPVDAINSGLELARGELVCVCIDGARMASPGLFSLAVKAARLHVKPAIGTLALHLGPEVQMRSVQAGYNQQVEDRLLASSGWEADGYRLFDISVFAGSSAGGWFRVPAETNALFMRKEHWRELGGYDRAFQEPGGGLVNLDMWKRATEGAGVQTIMLLGEGTFHQVHGGVATNSSAPRFDEFQREYIRLRGQPFEPPQVTPLFVGREPPSIPERRTLSL